MDNNLSPTTTTAFYAQSIASFVLSGTAMAVGIVYLPVNGWMRAFLCLGLLYVITSTVAMAKVVRDRQEVSGLSSRVDKARVEKLLAEHDPFSTKNLA
jgi:hypothetical protein